MGVVRTWVNWWLAVPAGEGATRRRAGLLAVILSAVQGLLAALLLINAALWLTTGAPLDLSYVAGDVVALLAFLGLWWLNRIGLSPWSVFGYLVIAIAGGSFFLTLGALDRVLIVYAIPILSASFVAGPRTSFVAAALSALGYSIAYLIGGSALDYNYLSVLCLFVLALLAWLAAESLEKEIAAHRRTASRYRATLLSVGDGVITTDAVGCVELMNPVAEALTGWQQDEARGKPLDEVLRIVNETTRLPVENPARRVLREGHVVGLADHTLLVARDGAERPIADGGAPIRDASGEIGGVVLVFRDQTHERAAQEALMASARKFREILEHLDEAYYSCTLEGRLLEHNPAFNRIMGFDPSQDLRGSMLPNFWQNREDRKAYLDEFLTKGVVRNYSIDALKAGGEAIVVMANAHLVRDERNRPVGIDGTFADITDRMLAEEQVRTLNAELEQRVEERTRQLREAQERLVRQERLAVLGQLAGSVGHELRKPLSVIANAAYLLELVLPEAGGKVQEYVGLIGGEVLNAERVIADLLDFARVRPSTREPVAVDELARRVLEGYPAPAGITVSLPTGAGLPPAYADAHQMAQVLGNLVSNAYEAMPEGGTLTISAAVRDDQIAISVADTGVGIEPENMTRIFEPLFTTRARGIGLGLPVCAMLAEANAGHIDVRSEPGQGATFTLYLPVHGEAK